MTNRLYVGNLSFDTTEDTLRAAFSADGRTVTEVSIVTDQRTKKPRGFGFVDMASDEEAQAVIAAMDGTTLDGRDLKVNTAKERKPSTGGERRDRY